MAKIIQFDPSRKVPQMYYTQEALRGQLLQFNPSQLPSNRQVSP
jgi:hypothetical protein